VKLNGVGWHLYWTKARAARVGYTAGGLLICLVILLADTASAQTTRPQVPQGSPILPVLPPAPPFVEPGTALPALPPPSAEVPNRTVQVTSVSVEGVSAFPAGTFDGPARRLKGPAIPLKEIDKVRQDILQRYRSSGYVLTTVSANLDASGRLRVIVTEGHIASVKLDGDIGPAGTRVLRFLQQLTKPKVIDSATLERYLLLAQDVPGVTLRVVLEPSTDEPGALTLIAKVSRQPVSGLFTFDNRAFHQTGPVEGLALLDFNSYSRFGENTEVTYYHTFPNTENFGQISEELFTGDRGLRFRVYAGSGSAVPSGTLSLLDYHLATSVMGGALTYPLIRSRRQNLNVYASLDGLDSEVRTNSTGTLSRTSFDSLRILRLGQDYTLSDIWLGAARSAVNAVSLRLSQGLHTLGAHGNGDSQAPRPDEKTNFTKIDFELSRTQTLFTPWRGASVALMGLLTGQWTNDILPPAEQFYLGGSRFTRGYYAGQVAGDRALAATVELQLNRGWDLSKLGLASEVSTQFYLFHDRGEVRQNSTDLNPMTVSSEGAGVRAQLTRNIELDVEAVRRLNRYPNGGPPYVEALSGSGIYWRLLGRF
jgi:hemolysin activation/secretion protein